MAFGTRRLFTSNYTGLANRLEGLSLSFGIQEAYGHEICLDWPELDAFEVKGTIVRKMHPWDRIGSVKILRCDNEQFRKLGDYRTILQRAVYSPDLLPKRLYLETAAKIRLKHDYAEVLRNTFAKIAGRPIVGVHIRGGDFTMYDERVYDIERARHQAVPLWWYEHFMREYRAAFRDVAFLLCHSGDPARFAGWREEFDTFEIPAPLSYRNAREPHLSAGHPVADLFALACCNVILATPNSSFSHFAANALGGPAALLLPPAKTTVDAPAAGYVQIHGERLPLFVSAATKPDAFKFIRTQAELPKPAPANTGWL
jgi:hypothetical protein